MKNLYSKLIVVAVIFTTTFSTAAQSSAFQISFFSRDLIKTVLSQSGCTGLRIYPVIDRNTNTKSVVIVGIDAGDNELSSKYQLYTGVRENNPTYSSIGKSDAKSFCDAYFSQNESFATDIPRETIEAFLSGNSMGIAVQFDPNQKGNFMVSGYEKADGLKPMDGAKPGDPCPNACGQVHQYLVYPKSAN